MNQLTPGPSKNRFDSKRDEVSSSYKYSKTTDQEIANLYEMDRTIGQGHFAVVKLAKHRFSNEKVAIKVIDKTKLDKLSREHLFQEVKCMKLVQHPNVVRLYEVIDTPNKLYLILELGDGGDMYDYIMKHSNGLGENQARSYFKQIVRAVKYCHDLHVVHRDLKPENVVFFEQNGQVKLTDFGFSNIFVPGDKLLTSCGSLAYSAPEILLGDSYDPPPVDIWSLGVILYMLVSGRAPFQEANDSETLTMILDCKYYLPSYISIECQDLISRMLVRNPEKRIKLDEIFNHEWLKIKNSSFSYSSGDDTGEDITNINFNKINNLNSERISKSNKKILDVKLNNNYNLSDIEEYYMVPLIKREHLSSKDNDNILETMINGNIANREEIIEALDQDKYNYITATYYLLAERLLKKEYFGRKKLKSTSNKKPKTISKQLSNNEDTNINQNLITKRKLSNQHQQKNGDLKIKRNILLKQEEATEEEEADESDHDQVAPSSAALMQQSTNYQKLFKKSEDNETILIKKTLTPIIAVEEDETEEDRILTKEKESQQIPLTNIIEDEEEINKQDDDKIENIQLDNPKPFQDQNQQSTVLPQSQQIRRCSRGGIIDNPLTSLTILEEVETDLSVNNNINNKLLNNSLSTERTSPILVSQVSNETVEDNVDFNNKYFYTIDSNKNNKSDYESDQDYISRNAAIRISNKSKNYSIQTRTDSSSDNSDNELKKLTKKMIMNTDNNIKNCIISINNTAIDDNNHDWSRSTSASSRSRNKYRSHSNNLLSKNETRHRPLSISSETADQDPITQYRLAPRTKSLAETSNNPPNQSNKIPSKQQSMSNSNDQLNNNNKTLSIEHRMANMSQMSISSQLSKNNSIRFFNSNSNNPPTNQINRNGSCDTPNFYLHNNSTTPTPRESIVFNRGDDRPPIAKILLSNKLSNDMVIKETTEITNKLVELSNSYENEETKKDVSEENTNKNEDSNEDECISTVTTLTVQSNNDKYYSNKNDTNNLIKQKIDSFNIMNANLEDEKSSSNIKQHNPSYSSAINNDLNKNDDNLNSIIKKKDIIEESKSIKNNDDNNNNNNYNNSEILIASKSTEHLLKKSNSTSSTSNLLQTNKTNSINNNQKLNQVSHKELLKPINLNTNERDLIEKNTNYNKDQNESSNESTSFNKTKQLVINKNMVSGCASSNTSASKKNCLNCHQCCIIV